MGATFDWSAEVVTCLPEYYRWNQWIFLQLMKAGLAYRQMAPVDWCPKDQVVLAREQVEGRRSRLLALRHAGHQARPRAVVLPHHEVRRRAAGLHGHRLAGAGAAHADELDRALGGRRGHLPHRPLGPPRRWRGAARLHDPAGHALRGHLHGPRAGTPAGGRADRARAARGGRGLRGRGPARDGDRAPLDGAREDGRAHRRGRRQPGQRRAHPHLDRRLRAGLATAPAPSWPCPATTSATSPSRSASGCPSVRVVAGPDDADDAPLLEAYPAKDERARLVNSGRLQRPALGRGLRRHRGRPGGSRRGPAPPSPTASATGW